MLCKRGRERERCLQGYVYGIYGVYPFSLFFNKCSLCSFLNCFLCFLQLKYAYIYTPRIYLTRSYFFLCCVRSVCSRSASSGQLRAASADTAKDACSGIYTAATRRACMCFLPRTEALSPCNTESACVREPAYRELRRGVGSRVAPSLSSFLCSGSLSLIWYVSHASWF